MSSDSRRDSTPGWNYQSECRAFAQVASKDALRRDRLSVERVSFSLNHPPYGLYMFHKIKLSSVELSHTTDSTANLCSNKNSVWVRVRTPTKSAATKEQRTTNITWTNKTTASEFQRPLFGNYSNWKTKKSENRIGDRSRCFKNKNNNNSTKNLWPSASKNATVWPYKTQTIFKHPC